MKLSEIVYNIKNLVGGGLQSDDFKLSDRQIAFIVNYYRAKLIKQEIDKGSRRSMDSFKQKITVEYDPSCGGFPVPDTIETTFGFDFSYVGTNAVQFQYAQSSTTKWLSSSKYTGSAPRYYSRGGFIFLTHQPTKNLKRIIVEGVFEDPKQAQDCGEPCGLDFDYPMPLDRVDLIVKLIAETEFQVLLSIAPDTLNDGEGQIEQRNGGNK